MAEFDQQRDELAHRRDEKVRAREQAMLARERVRRAERALEDFSRRASRRQGEDRAHLEQELALAQAVAARAAKGLEGALADEVAALKAFEGFTDPRRQLGQLSDDYPILLFPLRLETRFKAGPAGKPQLWVRVYPDTCLIDTFEASLSEQEVANAQAFWARVWRAGGDEALERAAWRELVASYGSGRAGWIVRQYTPNNPAGKPVKTDASDILLIVTASSPLPAEAATYWEAAWKASGAGAALQDAYDTLVAAVGDTQARDIVENHRPFNFDDTPAPPLTRADVRATVTVLQVTTAADLETRRTSWSSPARIELLPERFVLVATPRSGPAVTALGGVISTPLVASPDPNAPPEQQLKQIDDTLQIPDDIAWMFDFDKAVAVGMAMRVDLTADQARDGFERVIVLGVRLGDSPDQGRARLAQLLEHHLYSRSGLQILRQGTPTNNTEKDGAGYSTVDDGASSFETFMRGTPQYQVETNPLLRRDGEWLAELVGLPHELVQRIPNADGLDQSEARAMQTALWPGTLGYMMKTLLAPVFSAPDVAATRDFFTSHVSGRGPLPALRIGKQPYGIVPATVFDRITWFDDERRKQPFLRRLHGVLKHVDADWKSLVDQVSHVGKDGDPHQILLDVLGLHPSSVEYYPLQAESVEHKYYELSFLNGQIALDFLNLFPQAIPLSLLRAFGYSAAEVPDLLNKVFKAQQTPLRGPLIDDRPLSESDAIRAYAGPKNYIEWLVDAARHGIQALQQEQGFDGDVKPAALLYLMLRHALQLAFHATGVRLQVEAGVVENAAPLLREPAFVHVSEARGTSESRYDVLFRPEERITHASGLAVGDYIARNILVVDPDLGEQIEALERLASLPTARLERIFAEHVDCCTYRLDAWKTGLYAVRLDTLRTSAQQQKAPGLFLGAFGWVEPLRPEGKALTPAELPRDVATEVNKRDSAPLLHDPTNAGLIHAPSVNHAATAAVLRNGYLANGGQLAVNLSSRRVRLALGILEGMRNGQSLGALLGYQFERFVHDNGPLQVRDLIYPLRREFPLTANQIVKTNTETGDARESIAAMNVVDGRKMIERIEGASTPNFTYPFGVTTLPRRAPDQEQAITSALAYIRDINDAVADLVLAEGVHQAVLGNYERSAGTLDAFAKGNYPPEPDVVRTPRSGIALTLRTAIHLSPAPPANPLPAIAVTALATAEPAVNAWLKDRLPPPASVGCQVTFTDRASGTEQTIFVDQQQLALQPIDVLYRAQAGTDQALGDLDDLILQHVQTNHAPRHDKAITILHVARVADRFTWFELQALLRSLRALVLASRPLRPADLMRANDSQRDQQAMITLARSRVGDPRDDLNDTLLPQLDTLAAALGNPAITIDDALSQFAATVARFAAYRLPRTGTGFVFEWRMAAYAALSERIASRVENWDERLRRYDAAVTAYDALPLATPEAERMPLLRDAEGIISTALTTPAPASAADYRLALNDRRNAFVTRRNALDALVTVPRSTLAALLADAKGQLPLAAFDPIELSFTANDDEIARFRQQLVDAVAALKQEVVGRIGKIDPLLAQHDATGISQDKVARLQDAAKILFGEDIQLVPQITLPAAAADELANAWQYSRSGDLTRHLTTIAARDFPVDDWLHGAARVRDKMGHWENVVLLADACAAQPAELTPLQLPFVATDPWLAMELPDGYAITGDRLLYTAHFAEPFDPSAPICGLLVDEWTEVIPGSRETSGIAFHYDRPNCEPPQAWLLALAPAPKGAWSWDDLLAIVNETLDSAKRRAVEPTHVDGTAYGWFLPATASAYTFPEISISNNLLRNMSIYGDMVRSPR